MTKKEVMNMSDSMLDKTVKIQGTKFDRKVKVSNSTIEKMNWMRSCGKSYSSIANALGVSYTTVKYHTDPAWRAKFNSSRSGKHTGTDNITFNDRVSYKRSLLASNAHVIYPMD